MTVWSQTTTHFRVKTIRYSLTLSLISNTSGLSSVTCTYGTNSHKLRAFGLTETFIKRLVFTFKSLFTATIGVNDRQSSFIGKNRFWYQFLQNFLHSCHGFGHLRHLSASISAITSPSLISTFSIALACDMTLIPTIVT